jgi:hypothetical protein
MLINILIYEKIAKNEKKTIKSIKSIIRHRKKSRRSKILFFVFFMSIGPSKHLKMKIRSGPFLFTKKGFQRTVKNHYFFTRPF